MFIVFNKEKIYSYMVALSTVAVLFVIAIFFTTQSFDAIQTSAKIQKELPIYNVDTKDKKIALTMNCAWNADDIDIILDTLSKYKTNITFFMVGEWVEKFPDAVKKIEQAGHEIANHSDTHPHVNNLTLEKNVEEIKNCSQKIEKLTGKAPILYRGPYGEYNDTVIKAAKSIKNTTIQWNIDTLDYTGLTGEQMWGRIKERLVPGSIMLTHNATKNTASSLDMILYNIQQHGYKIVTVSDLIYKDNYSIDNNGMQKLNN